jgi:glycerophosphoryl diester phosphodiesterase
VTEPRPARTGNPLLDLSARVVIAHRGASAEAPENTLPAFDLAARQGADAFELDVRLTADGAPVVCHDPTLDRTTDGSGPLRARTLAELRAVDAGVRFSPDRGVTFPFRDSAVRIPTLGEVLWAFPRMPILIELKEPEAQEPVRRVLVQEDAVARCVAASERTDAVQAFREAPFSSGASGPEIAALYRAQLLRRRLPVPGYDLLSVPLRHRGLPVPTRRFVAAARSLGCPVHVWTINEPATARRLWARGVAGIVTNRPAAIAAARAATS